MLSQKKNSKKNADLFKKIFNNHFQTIVLFVLKYVGNDIEMAQDIAQESFIELWNSKISLSDIIHLKAFLFLTSKNKALNIIKHEQVKEKYFQKYEGIESERFYQNNLIEEETRALVQRAIDKLPEKSRKVILMRLDGYRQEDIASEMNISVDTVKYYRKMAFKILRENLKDIIYFLLLGI